MDLVMRLGKGVPSLREKFHIVELRPETGYTVPSAGDAHGEYLGMHSND